MEVGVSFGASELGGGRLASVGFRDAAPWEDGELVVVRGGCLAGAPVEGGGLLVVAGFLAVAASGVTCEGKPGGVTRVVPTASVGVGCAGVAVTVGGLVAKAAVIFC